MLRPAPLALAFALALAGCLSPTSLQQKLSDSAQELNTASRFGRLDVAMDLVSAKARQDFAKNHSGWGRSLRVVDLEFGGVNVDPKTGEAEVVVSFSWQHADDATIRVTTVSQRWTETRGNWALVAETTKGGDPGLLGEPEKPAPAGGEPTPDPAAAGRARFQTRVLHGSGDAASD